MIRCKKNLGYIELRSKVTNEAYLEKNKKDIIIRLRRSGI